MMEIIPAIIGQNFAEVREKIEKLEEVNGEKLVDWAQLDITDGLFTPEYSWQSAADLLPVNGKLKLEAHLMIEQPETELGEWLKVCDRVLIHPESTIHLDEILNRAAHQPVEVGLALLLGTSLEGLAEFIKRVKTVQLMGIATIGHYGEPLDERVYERIRTLRTQYPDVKINVDGGVNLANAKKLITAGADRLVIGSALWRSKNLGEAVNNFQQLSA